MSTNSNSIDTGSIEYSIENKAKIKTLQYGYDNRNRDRYNVYPSDSREYRYVKANQ